MASAARHGQRALEKVIVGEGDQAEALGTSGASGLFAPAQFFELTDAQKLSSQSLQRYDCGMKLADSEVFDGECAAFGVNPL